MKTNYTLLETIIPPQLDVMGENDSGLLVTSGLLARVSTLKNSKGFVAEQMFAQFLHQDSPEDVTLPTITTDVNLEMVHKAITSFVEKVRQGGEGIGPFAVVNFFSGNSDSENLYTSIRDLGLPGARLVLGDAEPRIAQDQPNIGGYL